MTPTIVRLSGSRHHTAMSEVSQGKPPVPQVTAEKVHPLASLAHRDFRLLLLGMPFSQTGLFMRNTANAWQVYEITNSSALLGLTFLFQGLPSMIMGLLAARWPT